MFPAPLCPRRPSVDQTTPLLSSTNFCWIEDGVQLGTLGRRLASSASSSSTVIRGGLADRRSHPESGGCNLTPPIHRGQRRPVGCAMSGLRFVRGGVPRGGAGRSQPIPGLRKLGRTTNCAARTGTSTCWPTQPGLRIGTTRRNRDDPRWRPRLALQRLRRRRCRRHCDCRRTAPAARHPIRLQAARPPSAALCSGGRTPRSSLSPRTWSKKATPPSQQDKQPSRRQRSLKGTRSQDAAPPIRAARAFEPENLTSAVAASQRRQECVIPPTVTHSRAAVGGSFIATCAPVPPYAIADEERRFVPHRAAPTVWDRGGQVCCATEVRVRMSGWMSSASAPLRP